jgi:hypothetical protein
MSNHKLLWIKSFLRQWKRSEEATYYYWCSSCFTCMLLNNDIQLKVVLSLHKMLCVCRSPSSVLTPCILLLIYIHKNNQSLVSFGHNQTVCFMLPQLLSYLHIWQSRWCDSTLIRQSKIVSDFVKVIESELCNNWIFFRSGTLFLHVN